MPQRGFPTVKHPESMSSLYVITASPTPVRARKYLNSTLRVATSALSACLESLSRSHEYYY
eukprot:scaffold153175_cov33-Tisochrysis_lutea.AAC.3